MSSAPGRLAAQLSRRVPRLRGLLADRDRWRTEALSRRARGGALHDRAAALQAALDSGRLHEQQLATELAREQARFAGIRKAAGTWPPGHYYSPVPRWSEIQERAAEIFAVPDSVPGIDFRAAAQLARLPEFQRLHAEHTFPVEPDPKHRYCLENRFFGWSDGLVYYCMLRSLRPSRVLEIGSGWSSALLLDVNEEFFEHSIDITFVEPYTERLDELLRESDREHCTIIEQPLWKVGDEPFGQLAAGDILFIDSTHVSRIGSDVNRLILDVLPTLPAGVHVHVHDIFYPFEYPEYWVNDGRAWNEAYLLRAYLADNPTIRITWSNSYLDHFHAAEVGAALPQWRGGRGGSIWLETLPGPGRPGPG